MLPPEPFQKECELASIPKTHSGFVYFHKCLWAEDGEYNIQAIVLQKDMKKINRTPGWGENYLVFQLIQKRLSNETRSHKADSQGCLWKIEPWMHCLKSPDRIFLADHHCDIVFGASLCYCPDIYVCLTIAKMTQITLSRKTATQQDFPSSNKQVGMANLTRDNNASGCENEVDFLWTDDTLARAVKRVALTPGVLAIRCPTAAKMLQFFTTSTCIASTHT